MYSAATFTNVSTDAANLFAAGDFSFKSLEWAYEFEGSEFAKQQNSGQNAAHSFVRRMTLTLTVQILGTSQADYWTNHNTFCKAVLVQDGTQSSYNHGTLAVTPTGGAAMYVDANVTGIVFRATPEEGAAFVSTATVTMRADRGYWRTVSGGTVVYF